MAGETHDVAVRLETAKTDGKSYLFPHCQEEGNGVFYESVGIITAESSSHTTERQKPKCFVHL